MRFELLELFGHVECTTPYIARKSESLDIESLFDSNDRISRVEQPTNLYSPKGI